MRVLFGLLVIVLVVASLSYECAHLILSHSGIFDLKEPTKLAAIMPQILAAAATIAAALVGSGVALINWLAQRDLAAVQRKYLHALEAKKNQLSIDLEREKAQLDVLKSEVSRNLALFQRAITVVGKYANAIRPIRRGLFKLDLVEESETEIRSLLIEFERDADTFAAIQAFLTQGIYLKERAERRTTPQGFKDLWAENLDNLPIGATFGRLENDALIAIRKAREVCLRDNALSTTGQITAP